MPDIAWIGVALAGSAGMTAIFFALRAFLSRLVDRRISSYQNDLVTRHCEEVQNIYRQMRGWRHDYHNHIQAMKAFRALEQNDKLDDYLVGLDADLSSVDTVIKSGNVMIDAILNSKLSLANSKKIDVNCKAVVPASIAVSEIDLCVIIGNLLDNAIEANLRCEDEDGRFIRVYIDVKGDHLYISVTNASGGRAAKASGRYVSSKAGANHGFGLLRIDRLVDKYEGYLKCRDEEGAFTSELMLPL